MSERDDNVAEGIEHILSALDVIAQMALEPEHYDEVAAEEVRLCQVIGRAQLILSFIDARRSAPRVVRRIN